MFLQLSEVPAPVSEDQECGDQDNKREEQKQFARELNTLSVGDTTSLFKRKSLCEHYVHFKLVDFQEKFR